MCDRPANVTLLQRTIFGTLAEPIPDRPEPPATDVRAQSPTAAEGTILAREFILAVNPAARHNVECRDCYQWLPPADSAISADGAPVCPDCATECKDCNTPCAEEDMTEINGRLLCADCADNYTECKDCDRYVDNDGSITVNGETVCASCADDYHCCDGCNDYVRSDDFGDSDDSGSYCQSCMEGQFKCERCETIKPDEECADTSRGYCVCDECYGHKAEVYRRAAPGVAPVIRTNSGQRVTADDWLLRIIPRLARLAERCATNDQSWQPRSTWEIGGFDLKGIDSDGTLTVGCHQFKLDEIRRFMAEEWPRLRPTAERATD